jgi:hypothetical protein
LKSHTWIIKEKNMFYIALLLQLTIVQNKIIIKKQYL